MSKNYCDIFEIHSGKKPKGTHTITLDLAKTASATLPRIIPGKKLCATCWKKLKIQPESSTSTVSDPSMASEGESFQIHEKMKQAEHDISRKQINSTLKVLGQSPLVLHRKPKENRRALVKRKLKAVTQNLNGSFSSVAGTNELDILIDEQSYASYSQHADRDLNRLRSDLKTQFEKATIHANKI